MDELEAIRQQAKELALKREQKLKAIENDDFPDLRQHMADLSKKSSSMKEKKKRLLRLLGKSSDESTPTKFSSSDFSVGGSQPGEVFDRSLGKPLKSVGSGRVTKLLSKFSSDGGGGRSSNNPPNPPGGGGGGRSSNNPPNPPGGGGGGRSSNNPPNPPGGGGKLSSRPPRRPPGGIGKYLLGLGAAGAGAYALHDKLGDVADEAGEHINSLRDKLANIIAAHHEA
jgi:hypothetical protein